MIRFPALIFLVIFISGCATQAEKESYAQGLQDRALCMRWMTTPDINQYHRALSVEIKRRGLDCWRYGNVAEEQRKAEAALRGALNRASGGGTQAPQSRSVQPPKGFTNCVISGSVISCTGPRGMVRCVDQGAGVLRCN